MIRLPACFPPCLLAFVLAWPGARFADADSIVGNQPLRVDVLVLNYDPLVASYENRRVHDVLGWNDPNRLAERFARNVQTSSGGFVQYEIVEWRDLNEIPQKADGFRYDVEQYVRNWKQGGDWHHPDTADYVQLLNDQGVPQLIRQDVVDEVWLFGGPYFGYWESAMAGPVLSTSTGASIRKSPAIVPSP